MNTLLTFTAIIVLAVWAIMLLWLSIFLLNAVAYPLGAILFYAFVVVCSTFVAWVNPKSRC